MSDDNGGRGIFVCQECGSHYLPPTDLQYPGGPASEIFCATCQPGQSPALAAQAGFNLADSTPRARSRGARRAGTAPVRRSRTGRGKLG